MPGFLTNLVLVSRLQEKGVSWRFYDSHNRLDAHLLLKPYGGMRCSIEIQGGSALVTKLRIASSPDGRQG